MSNNKDYEDGYADGYQQGIYNATRWAREALRDKIVALLIGTTLVGLSGFAVFGIWRLYW